MAETTIEPWVTEAGPIEAVAPAPVSTVAFLTAMFAVEALGAAILTVGSTDAWRTAAGSRHRVTGPTILTGAGRATILPKGVWRTSLIADDPGPALWAVTAVLAREASPPIPAVIAG